MINFTKDKFSYTIHYQNQQIAKRPKGRIDPKRQPIDRIFFEEVIIVRERFSTTAEHTEKTLACLIVQKS
jgi:hypothetical protein